MAKTKLSQSDISQCQVKTPYSTKQESQQAIDNMPKDSKSKINGPKSRLKSYKCVVCKKWHFGHSGI